MDEHLQAILARGQGFGHVEHLELAWRYLERLPLAAAEAAMASAIRHLAQAHGMPERYHATLTAGWVRAVAAFRAHDAGATFDDFIAAHPRLLERDLLRHHYSPERLAGPDARREFVEPDRLAFPV